jgi:prepilin-type processing-associated H-X9-DG protein
MLGVQNVDDAISVCGSTTLNDPQESRGGESWAVTGFHFSDYNHCLTPNPAASNCALDDSTEDFHTRTLHAGVFSATSRHGGGVNAMLMDGSVRFVKDSVNLRAWRALATRSGGEVVGEY